MKQTRQHIAAVAAVALAMICCAPTAAAQQQYQTAPKPKISMVYGVMSGINIPHITEKNDRFTTSNAMGFQAGAMMGLKFKSVELVPELWYNYGRTTLESKNGALKGRLSSYSLEMPILVAIPIGSIFRVNLGPVLTLMNNSSLSNSSGDDVEFGRIRSSAGWAAGVSATLWGNIILDARFNGYFNNAATAIESATETTTEYIFNHHNIALSIGYRF